MIDKRAIWIYLDGGKLDQYLCDSARLVLLNTAKSDESITTQQHLADFHKMERSRLVRLAQSLGISAQLNKILKDKRKSRKGCAICGAQ